MLINVKYTKNARFVKYNIIQSLIGSFECCHGGSRTYYEFVKLYDWKYLKHSSYDKKWNA